MPVKNNCYKLKGQVQNYQWGGNSFLPLLLGIANPEQKPFAEYWLGAHDNAPSIIEAEIDMALNNFLKQHPDSLGHSVQHHFGKLPYLLKVLDVHDMLSIQVHPAKAAAVKAFAEEDAAGVALNAPNRNYKDDNHKPELMVALGEFWLLHGFRSEESMLQILSNISQLHFLIPIFQQGGYKALYQAVMTMPQAEVNERLQPLLNNIIPLYKKDMLEEGYPDFWAARAALTFNVGDDVDRGIFSVYLLNLVRLQHGEAIFQEAGILHAYLQGQNIEIMANSDNVLRGGLTSKHIDVPELLKHVTFEAVVPNIIQPKQKNGIEAVYQSPAPDFQLSRLKINERNMYVPSPITTEIFLLMEGAVTVQHKHETLHLKRGEAFVAFDKSHFQIAAQQNAVIYRASVAFPQ